MSAAVIFKENWLTRKPKDVAYISSLFLGFTVIALGYLFLNGIFNTDVWMPASRESVFKNHEYWRLWSTLFAHADVQHLLSNLILLLPLSFLLSGFFGLFVFPIAGIFIGGFINYIVLQVMPFSTQLIGISGLVYWMGAVWLTLYIFIDRRKSLRLRIAVSLFLTVVLFLPETYRPEVSYLSHLVGYVLGVIFGILYYIYRRAEFRRSEVIENIPEDAELSYLDIEALAAGNVSLNEPARSLPDGVPLLKSVT
jgi:rhomboid protease GluP